MEISKSHQAIIAVAEEMLSGQTSIIEGSRQLAALASGTDDDLYDNEQFLIFQAIDSESDTLPTGKSRRYWNEEVLKEKDREIADYEARVKDAALGSCRWLLARYKTGE